MKNINWLLQQHIGENMDQKLLKNSELFKGIDEKEVVLLNNCTKIFEKNFLKDELIFMAGQSIEDLAVIEEGKVVIECYDPWGNVNIVQILDKYKVFGESYALLENKTMLFNVRALENCKIFFVEIKSIADKCPCTCGIKPKILNNLMYIMAKRNYEMNEKIIHTSGKSIRSRIISYLSFEAKRCGKEQFEIPYNRKQLAEYLKVDRSALSNELSKMRDEGLIEYKKNKFKLIIADDF